ncbi:AraC family transcriptional regulator ligand-binding domain-containing protein [Spongiibacter sp. KMU-158]|uniref:AraC family transcriptional regulator ligand-binding domain-containing protein n=1 Tax=Spongiibacter pelagi TaxID=2760804 RepID=A0A927C053_9GAMM|nr:AraC family transcriptional regulator [Spongiibacter pelagi]MBD2858809.1 AraC family transcriptional regulator ligand-binding domain-containing protein [Spongiibacter pelagi]
MDYLVRSGALLGYPELVASLGESPAELIAEQGLPPAIFQNSELYLSYLNLARLLNSSARRCARDDFGALLGAYQGLEVTGALASMLCLQSTMARALEMIQRHVDFHARGVLITAEKENAELVLSMNFAFVRQVDCDQLAQLSLGLLHRILTQLYGDVLAPLRVELRQARPASESGCIQLFGQNILYEQAYDRLRYPANLLLKPVKVQLELRERLSRIWRLDRGEALGLSLSQQVERAVVALLPTGDCNLNNVAHIVDLHPRVLQEHLKARGQSFSQILMSAREQLAREHLLRSDVSMTELAIHLGYSEVAVFSRNFKKWTGFSPLQWRKRHQS